MVFSRNSPNELAQEPNELRSRMRIHTTDRGFRSRLHRRLLDPRDVLGVRTDRRPAGWTISLSLPLQRASGTRPPARFARTLRASRVPLRTQPRAVIALLDNGCVARIRSQP